MDNFLAEGLRAGKSCMENQEWAYKPPARPPGPRGRTVANANLQRNLMSAPPVMKHPRDKQPERPTPPQVGAGAELVATFTRWPPRGPVLHLRSYMEALPPPTSQHLSVRQLTSLVRFT